MLAVDPDGIIYPCLRYMESSLAGQQDPYSIGDVNTGICQCDCHKCRVECLKKVDRRTQSTDECFYCLIGEGCSWCTAYNYQYLVRLMQELLISATCTRRVHSEIFIFGINITRRTASISAWRIMCLRIGRLTSSLEQSGIC